MLLSLTAFERIVFGVSAGIFLCTPVFGAYAWVVADLAFVFGSALVYLGVAMALPYLLRRFLPIDPSFRFSRILALSYAALCTNIVLNGLGALGWYRISYYYDDSVHFLTPVVGTIMFTVWYLVRFPSVTSRGYAYAINAMAAVVFVLSVLWEPSEIVIDAAFGVKTYGQEGQALDTLYDILMDCAGILAARVYIEYRGRALLNWLRAE